MAVHVCPVCNGKGKVASSFYPDIPQTTGTQKWVACRSCGGVGIVRDTVYPVIADADYSRRFYRQTDTAADNQ